MVWAGWLLTVLPAGLLILSAMGKIATAKPVVEVFSKLGWPEGLVRPIGIVELCCAVVLLVPRTMVLGAILVTGYMGGAIATHVRLGEPFVLQALVGVAAWAGVYFRDRRVRELVPVRR